MLKEHIMRKNWLFATAFAVALLSTNVQAQSCRSSDADKTAVIDALRTLYAGATVDDMAKMHSVTASTFYGFDGGHQYTSLDDLMKPVKAQQDQGVKYIWNVTAPKSHHPLQRGLDYLRERRLLPRARQRRTHPLAVAGVRCTRKAVRSVEDPLLP